ncbi:GPP34 family phosphoprotein [Mariniblastus sp.]|nr:GPP34 family phosphoprotein [Mariniblastus sp.]MDA9352924.1 GPP34 family phosphoprotein [bacterium]MDB4368778.1 GPP34 family phosphoprotein [bacterium]MDB4372478.1 GPP34 family phosphoprotein [Mariniblastus sp.]MDC3223637.1 GPP34 family phosphoprotein [Mariniblastus sp.]
MSKPLSLYQETLLLAIRDDKGTFSSGYFLYAIAGTIISELLLLQRIVAGSDKYQIVGVVDRSTTGDEILDEALSLIYASSKPRKMQHWVVKIANLPKLKHRIAQPLCDLGILRHDEKTVLWIFSQQRYPEIDGTYEDNIRRRMADVMFNEDAKPDDRTAVLIAVASHAGLLKANFSPEELRQYKKRIQQLSQGEILATKATLAAIKAMQAAVAIAVT